MAEAYVTEPKAAIVARNWLGSHSAAKSVERAEWDWSLSKRLASTSDPGPLAVFRQLPARLDWWIFRPRKRVG